MFLIWLIILIFLLLGYLVFAKPAVISFLLDTDSNDLHMDVKWVYPLLEVKLTMADLSPYITVLLFKKRFFAKKLKKQKTGGSKLLQFSHHLNLTDTNIETHYSMSDPFETGIITAAVQILQSLTGRYIIQYPNFMSDHPYIILQAGANLNVGKSALRIMRKK